MARHPKSIEQFKSRLAFGGVRPTMFQVELTFPTGLSLPNQNDLAEDSKFLVKAAQLPASQVGVIDVPFRGRKLKVSGDRSYADWSTSITNDHSFGLRVALEKWSELIQNHNFALGANELSQYSVLLSFVSSTETPTRSGLISSVVSGQLQLVKLVSTSTALTRLNTTTAPGRSNTGLLWKRVMVLFLTMLPTQPELVEQL